jgi:hypothetical protein
VFSLRAGFKQFQTMRNGVLDTLIIAGLEMQAVVVLKTTPMAAIQCSITAQQDGACHRLCIEQRKYQHHLLTHGAADFQKKLLGQGRNPGFFLKGGAIEAMHGLPVLCIAFVAMDDAHVYAGFLDKASLAANFLALAGTECGQKILKIAVPVVVPVEMTSGSSHKALAHQPLGIGAIRKQPVQGRRAGCLHQFQRRLHQQAPDQLTIGIRCQQNAGAGDGCEWDRRDQFRIVGDAGTVPRIRPGPVEYKFTVGIVFQIERNRTTQPVCFVIGNQVVWQPAELFTCAAVSLQRDQELMPQKRLRGSGNPVPGRGGNTLQFRDYFDAQHMISAAGRSAASKTSCSDSLLVGEIVEVGFGIECSHATGTGRGYCLSIDMVTHIAGGKYALDTGRRGHTLQAAFHPDIAIMHLQLAVKDLRIRLVANRDEHTRQVYFLRGAILDMPDPHSCHTTLVTEHFIQHVVPHDRDHAFLLFPEQAILQDLFGAEFIAPVDQRYVRGNIGQVQGFFHCGIPATDHCHPLLFVEKTITGGAGRNALAPEGLLRGQTEIHCRCPGGNDQCITGVCTTIPLQIKRAPAEINLVDMIEHDFGIESLGVQAHGIHERRTLRGCIAARPVFHIRRGH